MVPQGVYKDFLEEVMLQRRSVVPPIHCPLRNSALVKRWKDGNPGLSLSC